MIKSDNAASVTSGDDPDPTLHPGDTFTYTITATNDSATTVANGVVVTDTLDSDLIFVSATGGGALSGSTVTWNVGALTQGESVNLTVTVQVQNTITIDALQKELLNTVNITSITDDPSPANNTNSEPTNVEAFNSSLVIVKEAVAGQAADVAGEQINYTLAVQNTGNSTLSNVVVTDPFADVGSIVRGADAVGDDDALLEVGETWSYTAFHTVTQGEIDSNGGGDGFLENTATADSDESDPDSDDASVAVSRTAALTIVKEAVAGQAADVAGEQINYTLAVQNTGNSRPAQQCGRD